MNAITNALFKWNWDCSSDFSLLEFFILLTLKNKVNFIQDLRLPYTEINHFFKILITT